MPGIYKVGDRVRLGSGPRNTGVVASCYRLGDKWTYAVDFDHPNPNIPYKVKQRAIGCRESELTMIEC